MRKLWSSWPYQDQQKVSKVRVFSCFYNMQQLLFTNEPQGKHWRIFGRPGCFRRCRFSQVTRKLIQYPDGLESQSWSKSLLQISPWMILLSDSRTVSTFLAFKRSPKKGAVPYLSWNDNIIDGSHIAIFLFCSSLYPFL